MNKNIKINLIELIIIIILFALWGFAFGYYTGCLKEIKEVINNEC